MKFGKLYPMRQLSDMMRQGGEIVTRVSYCLINTFTNELYKGNPAAVCLLDEKFSEETMQKNCTGDTCPNNSLY